MFDLKKHGWFVVGVVVFLLLQILFSVNPEAKENFMLFFTIFFWGFVAFIVAWFFYQAFKDEYKQMKVSKLIKEKNWLHVVLSLLEISVPLIGLLVAIIFIWIYFN